eukprot:TRINITY_DN16194_c0_g1_i11.p1 TRINITY_DN16194_c0_g1~~TRINITY_DN16194_c0_g1_i11.p1  ORF type:complete len:295 (-),score=48.27 TRINITY_DN16194_c0_g1_i11:396-1280(-)
MALLAKDPAGAQHAALIADGPDVQPSVAAAHAEGDEAVMSAAFERLDKWKRCERPGVGSCLVYDANLSRARFDGFPSALENGQQWGLTTHEVAAVFGWSTGDYRFVNPIARGASEVRFEDYPSGSEPAMCALTREEVSPYIYFLSSALRKLPSDVSSNWMWRGHHRRIDGGPGSVVVFEGFTSASFNRDEAVKFAIKDPVPEKSHTRTLLVFQETCTGKLISKLSARRREAEVLFPIGAAFEVMPPPSDSERSADEAAANEAQQAMRKHIDDAEVHVVYLRELERGRMAGVRTE